MTWLLSLFLAFLQAPQAQAVRAKYQNWCQQGNQQVVTQGQNSTTRVQRSYPVCTITVFNHGTTTHAQLFQQESGGPQLGNPFMNQSQNTGQFYFYAAIGRYDVQIAAPGLMTFTLTDVVVGNGLTGPPGPAGPAGPPGPPGPPGPGGGGGGVSCGEGCVYPQMYGAKADGVILGGDGTPGCNGTAGSASITCAGANFAMADVGKRFDLAHAGTPQCGPTTYGRGDLLMNCNLVGTITAVTNATTVTLSTNVLSTVSNEQFAYASSDDAAVQMAINSGAKVIALSGIYGITGPSASATLGNGAVGGVFKNRAIIASGPGVGRLLRIGPVAWDGFAGSTLMIENGSENFTMQGVSIWGTNRLGELTSFGPTHDAIVVCDGFPGGSICAGSPGNANNSITNISFINCDFSHNWGIGWHAPGVVALGLPGIYGVTIMGGFYRYNSYDGINPNVDDGLIITGVNATYNGTGGLEVNSLGSLQVTGSVFDHNRSDGGAFGGITDATTHDGTCSISGNSFSENGNGFTNAAPSGTGTTVGVGLVLIQGPRNCSITGNTLRHNHQIGLQLSGDAKDQGFTITGNTISTNGIQGATVGTIGLYGNFNRALVSGNVITDENLAIISTAQRTGNVVTVTTWLPHNLLAGNTVNITGTPNGVFDGQFTVTTVPADNQFTFGLVGADTPPQSGGYAENFSSFFYQQYGINIQNAINSRFLNNHVDNNWNANIVMQAQFAYFHSVFQSESNVIAPKDIQLTGLVPSSTGMMLAIPDIQNTLNACMTGAGAGATCTVTVADNMGVMNKATSCSFRDTPNANAGFPIFLKAVPVDANNTTVTIGHIDGGAAGGGTMRCFTNFDYSQ